MIKVATPVSYLLRHPAVRTRIADLSDCFECRDETLGIQMDREFLYHCSLQIIHPLPDPALKRISEVIRMKPNVKLISFHAATCCDKPCLPDGQMYVEGGKRYNWDELLQNAKSNLQKIRSISGDSVRFAVENNNFYPTSAYEIVTEPEFLSDLVSEADLAFVYDLGHAQVTACNRKLDFLSYQSKLPIASAVQIHLSRPTLGNDGIATDDHLEPTDAEFGLLSSLLESYTRIRYATLEYYRNPDECVRLLTKLRSTIDGVSR